MAQRNLSKIVDDNGDEYLIKAKGLESQVQIALSGDVTGSATTDLSGDVTISSTIANGAVSHAKLATDAVQNDVIKDGEITKSKFNASVYDETGGSIADGTNSNLATKTQVKAYVESVVSSEGHYKGVQSVTTINSWTASNLHNGDRVITSSDPSGSGTGTLTLGNLPVVDGQMVIFYVSDDQSVKIWQSSEGNYKIKQTAVSDPTASGTTLTAISTISQNANGEINVTKKTIQDGTTSQKGVVQLAGSIGATVSSENNKAASEKAVRDAINALDAEKTSSDGTNVQVKVTEADGKITAVSITTDNTESKNNKVTSWSSTTTDTNYPSEKLVKDSLDGKADKVSSATAGDIATLDANGNLVDSGTSIANAHVAKADQLNTARNIDGVAFDGTAKIHHFGTCSTAAGTAAKTVTLDDSMTFTLEKGASVFVKFTNSNTVASPTLAVNGTTAKSIMRYGTTAPSTTAKSSWQAGSIVHLVYDGTYWQMVGWLNDDTTYSNASLGQGYGTCSTAEATAEKAVTLSGYTLATGGIVAVKFTYGLCASATMNINSKGAKAIVIDGAAVTDATAKRVLANDIAYFIYDGAYNSDAGGYHFLGTDHAERAFTINYRSSDNALVISKAFGTAS